MLMGIDIGTSAVKAAVFSHNGEALGSVSEAYDTYYPEAGWAEQNPNHWWESAIKAIKKLLCEQNIKPQDIEGIGVDGQSWSAIPIDKNGDILCNTPIWFDTRAQDICNELKAQIGEKEIFNLCKNPLSPSYTLPKILWYKKYKNEMYQSIYTVLQANSFIVYKFTDQITQDISQCYGYHCFDMEKGKWDSAMCKEMGIDERMLPDIFQSHHIVGTVSEEAAKQSGLIAGTPVAAGGLDAACGTLGAGVIEAGQTQEQGGQAGGMSICRNSCISNESLILGYHVVPERWLLQGGTVGGGGVIRWFEKEFCHFERTLAKEKGTSSFIEMDEMAGRISIGSEGLLFLPYMAGERSPIWNPQAKGVFFGLDYNKTRAHMIRSAMEGVTFSLLHNFETAQKAGAVVTDIYAMGGAANSRLWTQMKADVLGKKIVVPSSDTATTLGAAILAGVGTGVYQDFNEAVEKTIQIKRIHEPDMEANSVYQKFYPIYRELYENLKGTMEKLSYL